MKYHLVIQGQLSIPDEEIEVFEKGTKYVIQRGRNETSRWFDDAMREALRELENCRMVTISLTEDR